ncbi:MAG TPA: TerC/Alx family metal homeostasis membrane protein [Catalimonadaceae bacterium]|nr:TerC/Alx family metal homeostasis membrane protein [Catalimonadaceae bacterium]HPI12122.1 TerC/Alx family metal homeostasis membrane protein [Catalimonadaceae bacterium]
MSNELLFFTSFLFFVALMIFLDLGVFSKNNHVVQFKEAASWSVVWILCATAFYLILDTRGDLIHGIDSYQKLEILHKKYADHVILVPGNFEQSLQNYRDNMSLEFITGYLVEYALSVDNIFVLILIFSSFGVREKYFKKVLFWGILGAVILRCIFIFIGSALLQEFSWIMYLFGAFLAFTGIRMFFESGDDDKIETDKHPVVQIISKILPVFPRYVGENFFVKKNAKWMATPLFVVLMIIEFTDLIFAVDSVPAVFSVTKDPYLVFFSNIFAVLGLRSMFFFLANILHIFHYLNIGLAVLLTYIGSKMLAHNWLKSIGFTNAHSLYIIIAILAISILASVLFPKKKEEEVAVNSRTEEEPTPEHI